jgi:hypothetical protein
MYLFLTIAALIIVKIKAILTFRLGIVQTFFSYLFHFFLQIVRITVSHIQ